MGDFDHGRVVKHTADFTRLISDYFAHLRTDPEPADIQEQASLHMICQSLDNDMAWPIAEQAVFELRHLE